MWCRPSTLHLSNCIIQNTHGTEGRMRSAGRLWGSPGLDGSIWCFWCAPCDDRGCDWTPTLTTPVTVLILLISSVTSQVTADPITASSADFISLPVLRRSLVHYLTAVRCFCKIRLTDFDTDTFEILKNCPPTLILFQGSKSLRNWQSHSLSINSPAWFATIRFISSFTRAHHVPYSEPHEFS